MEDRVEKGGLYSCNECGRTVFEIKTLCSLVLDGAIVDSGGHRYLGQAVEGTHDCFDIAPNTIGETFIAECVSCLQHATVEKFKKQSRQLVDFRASRG